MSHLFGDRMILLILYFHITILEFF